MTYISYDDAQKLKEVKENPPDLGYSRDFSNFYQRGEQIGSGGFGIVYKAKQLLTGKTYACKEIIKILDIPDLTYQKQTQHIENVQKEIKVLKILRGILNVVHLINVYENTQKVFLVMELCSGGPIFDRYQKIGSEGTAASIARAVLRTLLQCHAKRILHRDIKPSNFLFLNDRPQAPIKAIDFGLAVFYDPDELPRTDLGLDGTPWFQAPEVLNGQYYPKSDIWSCGVLCYQMLCGNMPFDDRKNPSRPSLSLVWRSILVDQPKLTGSSWQHVSEEAKDFVQFLLNKDHEKRPSALEALQHPWLQDSKQVRNYGNQIDKEALARIQRYSQRNLFKQKLLDLIAQELLQYYAQKLKDQSQHGGEEYTKKTSLTGSQSVHNAGLYWRDQAEKQQSQKRLDLHPNLEQLGQLAQTVYENSQRNKSRVNLKSSFANAQSFKDAANRDFGSYHGASYFKDYSDKQKQESNEQQESTQDSKTNKQDRQNSSKSSRDNSKNGNQDQDSQRSLEQQDSFRDSLQMNRPKEYQKQGKGSLYKVSQSGNQDVQIDAKKQIQSTKDLTRLSVYNEQDIEPLIQEIKNEDNKSQGKPGEQQLKLSASKQKDQNPKQGKGFFDIVKSIRNKHKFTEKNKDNNGVQQNINQQVRNASNFKDLFQRKNSSSRDSSNSKHHSSLPEIPEDNPHHKDTNTEDTIKKGTINESDKRASTDQVHPNIKKLFQKDLSALDASKHSQKSDKSQDDTNTSQDGSQNKNKNQNKLQSNGKQQEYNYEKNQNRPLGAQKQGRSVPNLSLLNNGSDSKQSQQVIQAQKDYIWEHIVGMAILQQGSQLPYNQVLDIFKKLNLTENNQQIDPVVYADVLKDHGYQINEEEILQLYGYANGQNEAAENQMDHDKSQTRNIDMTMFISSQVDWKNFKLQFYNDWTEVVKRTFSNIDKDSDGKINKEEITKYISKSLPSQNIDNYVDAFMLDKAASEYGMDMDGFLDLIENAIHQPDEDLTLYDNRYKQHHDKRIESQDEGAASEVQQQNNNQQEQN